MNKSIPIIFFLIIFCPVALAADFTPQGDMNGRNVYDIFNFTNISASGFFIGDGSLLTGLAGAINLTPLNNSKVDTWTCPAGQFPQNGSAHSVNCIAAVGSGDITAVYTQDGWLSGGVATGDANLTFNSSKADSYWNDSSSVISVNSSLQSEITLQAANNVTQAGQISTEVALQSANNITQASALDLLRTDNTTQASQIATEVALQSTNNITQAAEIALKLNITDQRYNDTGTNCNASGTCSAGGVAYLDYANIGNFNISGNLFINQWIGTSLGLTLSDDGSTQTLTSGVGGTNEFIIETSGTFLSMVANPGPANNYLMFNFAETQGADTFLNMYEGGTGHNRFWDSGSMRIGGAESYLCSALTSEVDCDTAGTGADLVVQDDIWAGGNIIVNETLLVKNAPAVCPSGTRLTFWNGTTGLCSAVVEQAQLDLINDTQSADNTTLAGLIAVLRTDNTTQAGLISANTVNISQLHSDNLTQAGLINSNIANISQLHTDNSTLKAEIDLKIEQGEDVYFNSLNVTGPLLVNSQATQNHLYVNGTGGATGLDIMNYNNSGFSTLRILNSSGSVLGQFGGGNGAAAAFQNVMGVISNMNTPLIFGNGISEHMRLESDGRFMKGTITGVADFTNNGTTNLDGDVNITGRLAFSNSDATTGAMNDNSTCTLIYAPNGNLGFEICN